MTDDEARELEHLRGEIAELRVRVSRLERSAASAGESAAPPFEARVSPRQRRAPRPAAEFVQETDIAAELGGYEPLSDQAARPKDERDLETVIGTQWLNRLGILAMFVAVAYFLRHAFQNDWIGPAGRVGIGVFAGILVVLWSERFRRRGYLIFSWTLKALGLGVLYLSLWAAHQVYDLVPSEAAFAAMALVTVATVALALWENSQLVAAFALLGGFATPLLLWTGENRQIALFSYVALLDLGVLALLTRRWWPFLIFEALLGTTGLYLVWYERYYDAEALTATLVFSSLFFVIFAVLPLTARWVPRRYDASVLEGAFFLLPLINEGLYFAQAWVLLEEYDRFWPASLALALAAAFLGLGWGMARREDAVGARSDEGSSFHLDNDVAVWRDLAQLHVLIAVGLITLAVPIKLDTPWATWVWLGEAAGLLLLGRRFAQGLLVALAACVLILAVARLVAFDNFEPTRLLLNYRALTYLLAIGVLAALTLYLSRQEDVPAEVLWACWITINGLALLGLTYEIHDFFARRVEVLSFPEFERYSIIRDFAYSALWLAYGAALMAAGFVYRLAVLRWQALAIIAVTSAKVFLYDVAQLTSGYRILSFLGLGIVLLAVSFAYQRDWLRLRKA